MCSFCFEARRSGQHLKQVSGVIANDTAQRILKREIE